MPKEYEDGELIPVEEREVDPDTGELLHPDEADELATGQE
jgi:hypothetical protein